jgi:DNA-binding GntR family transcriptional regulator
MRDNFKPSNNLCAQIAEYLSTQIIKGELKSGERIKEARLAQELGVSRGPVREALHVLEKKRLVEMTPRRGARVTQMSASYAASLYDIIVELYGLAARKAAENRSSKDLQRIRDALKIIKDCADKGDVPGYNDAIFQLALVGEKAAKNPLLEQMLSDLEPVTRRVQFASLRYRAEDLRKSVAFFEHFVQYTEAKDGEMACQTIRSYTENERELALRSRRATSVGNEKGKGNLAKHIRIGKESNGKKND